MSMCIHCTHVVRVCCVLHVLTFEEVQDITATTCVRVCVCVCVCVCFVAEFLFYCYSGNSVCMCYTSSVTSTCIVCPQTP